LAGFCSGPQWRHRCLWIAHLHFSRYLFYSMCELAVLSGCSGTSVAFFGNTPPARDSQWSLYSIDGGPAHNSSFMDPSPSSSRQWYQSPVLPDGQHNITITHIASTSVDYAVITAGENTPLLRQVLIVDDADPSVSYGGSWTQNTGMFTTSYDPFIGLPYGNSTHQTTSVGASATFSFTGMFLTLMFLRDILT
jgi:hypothetical protein